MTFYYESNDESILPPIYPNIASSTPLSDCHKIDDIPFVYCEIKKNELNYFNYYSYPLENPIVYNMLCGYKQSFIFGFLLNKNVGISLRIKNFTIPEEDLVIKSNTILTVVAEYDGAIDYFQSENNIFFNFVKVEYNNLNKTNEIACFILGSFKSGRNIYLKCVFNIPESLTIKYDNIYLLPYYAPYEMEYDYEVIIKETIKCAKESKKPDPKPVPSFSRYLKSSIGFILGLLVLF